MAGHAGKRFDIICIDLVQLGNPVKDAVQPLAMILTILRNIDAREAGDSATVLLSTDMVLCFAVAGKSRMHYHRIWRSASLTTCRRRFPRPAAPWTRCWQEDHQPRHFRCCTRKPFENPVAEEIHPGRRSHVRSVRCRGGWRADQLSIWMAAKGFAGMPPRLRACPASHGDLPIAFSGINGCPHKRDLMLSVDMTRYAGPNAGMRWPQGGSCTSTDRLDAMRDTAEE